MTPEPKLNSRRAGFSRRAIVMLSLLCFALVAIPVVTHPLPPLSDYVNHLARMQIIAEGTRDPDLARYYSLEWAVIPNLMMDLLVPIIDRVTNVYVAGEIYTLACFALILFGTQLLHRALFGQWSVVPLLAAPLLYNGIFLIGVMNYVFGIGLALVALSCWVLMRASPWRYLVSLLFVGALYFCHLVSVGVYGMGLLAFEIMRLMQTRGAPLRPRLIDFVCAGLPFALVVPLLLKSPTWGLAGENYWEPRGKIDGLEFVITVYFDHVAFALTAIVVAGALWAARHRQLRIHPFLMPLLCVGGVVYLAMPRTVFATYMADQRLPVALAFMVLATFQVDLHHRLVRHGFVIVLLAAVLVRVGEVQIMWDRLTTWTTAFDQSVKQIDRGARVLVVYADPRSGRDATDLGLVHAACLAIIEKSALVPTVFTVAGKQILRVRPPYRDFVDTEDGFPPTLEQLLLTADAPSPDTPRYWDLWPEHFDYVYLLYTEPDEMNPDPDRLTLVYDGGRFQLYKVRKPQTPS